jgi:beta-galactosidase
VNFPRQSTKAGTHLKRFAIFAALLLGSAVLLPTIIAQSSSPSATEHPDWPGHGQLFVGTCYQPIDRSPEEIHRDIGLMKQAGFSLVRMGDLSWDSFECTPPTSR